MMSFKRGARTAALVALAAIFVGAYPHASRAGQLVWKFDPGVNILTASKEGIHIDQKEPVDTTAYGRGEAAVNLAGAKNWRIDFDARFGVLRPAGSAVCLTAGGRYVCWLGADGFYKGMSVFLGDSNMVHTRPADTAWHHFEFRNNGATISAWLDGVKVGGATDTGTPDTISVGIKVKAGNGPGQQTEMWLRDVHIARDEYLTDPAPAQRSVEPTYTQGATLPTTSSSTSSVSVYISNTTVQPAPIYYYLPTYYYRPVYTPSYFYTDTYFYSESYTCLL
jgi:hypothetical protein